MCVFGDSLFDVVGDQDSAFGSDIGVVCVALCSVHVSCVPVLSFLYEYYCMFPEFGGHLVACFFKVFGRAFVGVPCRDCVRVVFVSTMVDFVFRVIVRCLVYLLVVVVRFVLFVVFGWVFWMFAVWYVLILM